jgi:hypothetical protein
MSNRGGSTSSTASHHEIPLSATVQAARQRAAKYLQVLRDEKDIDLMHFLTPYDSYRISNIFVMKN